MEELRVLALVVEPPEAAPGAELSLSAWVADPLDEAPELMIWTCTDLGEGCLEAARADQGTTVGRPEDGVLHTTRTVPEALAYAVADGETVLPVPLWALACVPGACPVLDLAAEDPAGSAELSAFLADPFAGMEELPRAGTSLAFSTLGVSTRAEPVVNPSFTRSPGELRAAPEESLALDFETDAAELWGYATAGGFAMPSYAVEGGAARMEWVAPAAAGSVRLWVVANGAEGGAAVWSAEAVVE